MDLKEEDVLGDAVDQHWYYRSKAQALRRYVAAVRPHHILDVGAGSGFFSKELLRHTDAEDAICVDIGYPAPSQSVVAGKPIYFHTSYNGGNADLVLLMDVLEHVDDDTGLLRDYVDKVGNGAFFLITVPAFSFLWSGHDLFLEHRRRYTLAQLEKVARSTGLTVERSSYYYGLVFPLAAAIRLSSKLLNSGEEPRSQLKIHNPLENRVLSALCAAERPFMKFNRVAGLSVFCLCRKP